MSDSLTKNALRTTLTMLAFALVGTALLAYIFDITRAPIEKSEAEARMALFQQIFPHNKHDNDLLKRTVDIPPNTLLGTRLPTKAHIATLDNQVAGIILEAIAHDGYSGDIKLLIAIDAQGNISGVRVLAHKETPGLGDYIDITRGHWIESFNAESLGKTPEQQWQVKKDGGKFDYMAGATITPRAVIKAVLHALQFFEANKQHLLQNSSTSTEPLAAQ